MKKRLLALLLALVMTLTLLPAAGAEAGADAAPETVETAGTLPADEADEIEETEEAEKTEEVEETEEVDEVEETEEGEEPEGLEEPAEPAEPETPDEPEEPEETDEPDWASTHRDLRCSFRGDGTCRLDYYSGSGGDVVIPADVTEIVSFFALGKTEGGRAVTSVTFEAPIAAIPRDMFLNCTGLERVSAPAGTGLTWDHFRGCASLSEEGLPAFVRAQEQFVVEDGVLSEYHGLGGDVTVPEGVRELGRAFCTGRQDITSITLPSTLRTIQGAAISYCDRVILPAGFDLMHMDPFAFTFLSADAQVTWSGRTRAWSFWEGEIRALQQEELRLQQEEQRKENAKNRVRELWDSAYDQYKGDKRYQESVAAARDFAANGVEERYYKYTWVTSDVQTLSDQLAAGCSTDREKVLAFHDWVTENIYYDYEDRSQYNAQQVLDNKNCVCSGYARLMQALCWAQGIPAAYMSGTANGSHAWNLIRVDGAWAWMDATWDTYNAYYGGESWVKGSTRYDYCLCPSEFIATDHAVRGPVCELGVNVDSIAYYGVILEQEYPNTVVYNCMLGDELLFTEETVAAMNRLRRQEGLEPVKLIGAYLYYPASPGYDGPAETPGETAEPVKAAEPPKDTGREPHDWALDEVAAALEAGLVPADLQSRYADAITRLDFCRLMVALVEKSGKRVPAGGASPFTDVDGAQVTAAYTLGIVKGVGGGRFNPAGSITRQEAAVMLARTADLLGLPAGPGEDFADEAAFADWGRAGILRVSGLADPATGNKVMQGTGGGSFSPRMTYSREQAILTALRLYRAGK